MSRSPPQRDDDADAVETCPECGGPLGQSTRDPDLRQCEDCDRHVHAVAVEHQDLLADLAEEGDDAIATAAETILSYEGGH